MLARLGHKVLVLRRVALGPVRLDKLRRGKARRLKVEELERLRSSANRLRKLPGSAETRQLTQPVRQVQRPMP